MAYSAVISNNTIANNGAIYFYGTFRNNSGGFPGSIGGPPDLADERIAFDGFRPRSDSILVDAGASAPSSHILDAPERHGSIATRRARSGSPTSREQR